MSAMAGWLEALAGPVLYAAVALLVFCEDAIFVGFVLPGETAVVVGGVLAGQGHASLGWLALCVVAAAIAGDSVGYEIGHRYGARVLTLRPLRPHAHRIAKVQGLLRRHGAGAVFLGRFLAFFRALMPAAAGVAGVPYRRFLLFNALGGLVWGLGYTLLGYLAGQAYARLETQIGRSLTVAILTTVLLGLLITHLRRRNRTKGRA